jgi:DNA-binding NtrC family response regulator
MAEEHCRHIQCPAWIRQVIFETFRRKRMYQQSILIVDDEEMIIKSIQRTLRKENYNIFSALNGEEALDLLQAREIDLVISDQNMPGISGIEFLGKVKSNFPSVLTIMLTGQTDIEVAIRAINDVGIYKFILKPWDDHDFIITIRRALESLNLVRERNALQESVRQRDAILKNLEKEHPGITRLEKDKDGFLILE